jgi:hypothetical protein
MELTRLGVPMVAVNADGEPYATANLPFEADLATRPTASGSSGTPSSWASGTR